MLQNQALRQAGAHRHQSGTHQVNLLKLFQERTQILATVYNTTLY